MNKKINSVAKVAVVAMLSLIFCATADAALRAQVFVSFSMPETLLKQTLKESARFRIPAILNGLHQNSMPATVSKIMELSKEIPQLNLQIDPTAFERFAITQVPALVVEKDNIFDVIYGNLTLEAALMRIKESGETHLNEKDFKEIGLE